MLLFLLLVAIPIIEIALFIQVGGAIGTWPTLAIVVATAFGGTILLRGQGLATMNNLRSSLAQGRNPVDPIAHGAFILVAGILLLTPGFFTDATGIAFLIPPIRTFMIRLVAARLKTRVVAAEAFSPTQNQGVPREGDVVDADYEVVEPDNATKGNSGWTNRDQ